MLRPCPMALWKSLKPVRMIRRISARFSSDPQVRRSQALQSYPPRMTDIAQDGLDRFTQPLGLIQLSQPSLARISCTASTILRCVVIGSATTPRDYRDDESIAKNVFSFDSKSAFNELFLLAWTFLDLYRRYVTAKTWKAKTSGSTSLTGPTSELSTAFTFAAFPIFPLGSFRKIHPDFSAAPEVRFSWNPQSCSSSQIKVLMGVPVECLGCIQKLGTNKVEAKQSDEDPEHCSIAE